MIKAEILTAYRRYTFEVPAEYAESVALAHDWVENQIYGAETEGYIELPGRVINISHPDDVRSIEVWEEGAQLPTAGLVSMAGLNISDAAPNEYTGQVEFLGNKLELRAITYQLRGYTYFLPFELNGTPALDVLGHEKLGQVTDQLLQREGLPATILIPPVSLANEKEAGEYVMDYAEQATPPAYFGPGDKTARAAGGLWNGK
jgi:hypothetical protein